MKGSHATAVTVLGLLFAGVSWLMKWDNMVIAMGVCTALGAVIGYFVTGNIRAEQQEMDRLAALPQEDPIPPRPRGRQRRQAEAEPQVEAPLPAEPVRETVDPTYRPDVVLALMDGEMSKYAGTEFPARWLKTRQLLETVPANNKVWQTLRSIALNKDVEAQALSIQKFLDAFDEIMSKRGR